MIKLVDQLSAMGSFPIATAQDIVCSDNERLQEKIDNGTLGGGGGSTATTLTQEEYDALDPQEQLEGEFYCYDSARHFRNGVEYGKAVDISGKQDNLSQVKFTMRRNSASEGRYCLIGSSDLSQNLLMCEPYRFQGIFGDGTTSVENKSIIDFMVSFREGVENPDDVLSGFANSSKGFDFVDLLITADETTNMAYAYVDFKTSGSVATGEITKPVLEAESYMDFAESFELVDTYHGTLVCKMSDYCKVITEIKDEVSDSTVWSSKKTSDEIADIESALDELENITRLTDFDEAIPEKGKNKIYYVNKLIGTYNCAQWRVESMYYDVSGAKQYRGVQKATSINGVDNIMLMREYYLDDNNMRWSAWTELATMDKVQTKDDTMIKKTYYHPYGSEPLDIETGHTANVLIMGTQNGNQFMLLCTWFSGSTLFLNIAGTCNYTVTNSTADGFTLNVTKGEYYAVVFKY